MPRGGLEVIDDDIRLAGETILHVPLPSNEKHQEGGGA
jgi:hypothetical protein